MSKLFSNNECNHEYGRGGGVVCSHIQFLSKNVNVKKLFLDLTNRSPRINFTLIYIQY